MRKIPMRKCVATQEQLPKKERSASCAHRRCKSRSTKPADERTRLPRAAWKLVDLRRSARARPFARGESRGDPGTAPGDVRGKCIDGRARRGSRCAPARSSWGRSEEHPNGRCPVILAG
ncbi:MAG: hypothetical protein ACLTCB_00665 [Merdibacter sp.]